MRIKVYTSSRSTDGSNNSNNRSSEANNLLSVFPAGISLSRVHSDHIYSAGSETRTLDSEAEWTDTDEDSLSESGEESESETPIKPRVIKQYVGPLSTENIEVSRQDVEYESTESIQKRRGPIDNYIQTDKHACINGEIELDTYMERVGSNLTPNRHKPTEGPFNDSLGHINSKYDSDMLSLNADSIQKVFQNTIDMTLFTPIGEESSREGRILSNSSRNYGQYTPSKDNHSENTPSKTQQLKKVKFVSSDKDSGFHPFKVYDQCVDKKGQKCVKLTTECHGVGNNNENPLPGTSSDYNRPGGQTLKQKPTSNTNNGTKCTSSPLRNDYGNGARNKIKLIKHSNSHKTELVKKSCKGNDSEIHRGLGEIGSKDEASTPNEHTEGKTGDTMRQFCKTVNDQEYKEISKDFLNDRELYIKINYTLELLVKKWGEYLLMTSEQVREMEIKNAKQINMVEEVVEMLEDKDRYVWELVDNLMFF